MSKISKSKNCSSKLKTSNYINYSAVLCQSCQKVLYNYYNQRKKNTFSLHWASFVHKRKETKSTSKTTIEQGEKNKEMEKKKKKKTKKTTK
jgi:hypothetical protein